MVADDEHPYDRIALGCPLVVPGDAGGDPDRGDGGQTPAAASVGCGDGLAGQLRDHVRGDRHAGSSQMGSAVGLGFLAAHGRWLALLRSRYGRTSTTWLDGAERICL